MPALRTFALTGLASLGLALAACDGATDDTAPPVAATPGTSVSAATSPPMLSGEAQPVTTIPAAMQGRWGMNTADCDPDEAANKGLMTVDANTLQFYESVAEMGDARLTGGTMLRGTFAYEGEGMQWTRDLTLSLSGADTLTLEELGDDAVEGPRQYTRCA